MANWRWKRGRKTSSFVCFWCVLFNIWPKCMHNNWETRMCLCINLCHRRWLQLIAFERIFAHNAIHIHLAMNINSNTRWTYESIKFFFIFQLNWIEWNIKNDFSLTRTSLSELIVVLNQLGWPHTSNCLQKKNQFRNRYFGIWWIICLAPDLPWLLSAACGVTYWKFVSHNSIRPGLWRFGR